MTNCRDSVIKCVACSVDKAYILTIAIPIIDADHVNMSHSPSTAEHMQQAAADARVSAGHLTQ